MFDRNGAEFLLATTLQKSPLPQFKGTLGWIRYRQGDYKAALPLLDDAATALPNAALIHYHLGMAYLPADSRTRRRNSSS